VNEIEARAMDIALESAVRPRPQLADRIIARARRRSWFAPSVAAACLAAAFGAVWLSGGRSSPPAVVRSIAEIDALSRATERVRGEGRFGDRELAALVERCPRLREVDVRG
jgi:hypothetical protein